MVVIRGIFRREFRRWRALHSPTTFSLYVNTKHTEGLFGGTFVVGGRLRTPEGALQLPVNTFAIGERRTISKGGMAQ